MKFYSLHASILGLAAATALSLAGCAKQADQPQGAEVAEAAHGDHDHAEHDHEGHARDGEPTHGGWWCYEHAIPEEQCAMCDAKLAAEMREKGDWCEEHNRPDSLCFKCHPENAEKFAALFEAKYGEKPPAPTE